MTKSLIPVGGTDLSLELPKGQSFDEWVEVGRNLASANKVLNWWIGDWWAAGSHRYGERAKVAAEGIFGRDFSTLASMASVARAFESCRRRQDLSFSHHAEVASLDPSKADELLEKAERDGWTRNDIRAEAAVFRRPAQSGRVTTGDERALEVEWSALVGSWNRARTSIRERFLSRLNGTEPVDGG